MLRSEFGTPSAAFLAEQARIALPLGQGGAGEGANFGALMRQVQGEIGDYIAHGAADASSGSMLSVEARAWLARQQGATADVPAALSASQQSFLADIAPWAAETGQRLGVAPNIIAAQAALESGWGQHPLRQADGSDSHNLFGIKAGGGWQGDIAASMTTEFEGGVAVKKNESFRSYADGAEAFRDFTRLLSDSPRYQAALNTGGDARAYANALMRGGYATDPAYADKLTRLAARLQGD